jgi:hypothetical protein
LRSIALKPPLEPAALVSDFGVFAGRSAAFVPLDTGAPEDAPAPAVEGAGVMGAGAVVVVELEVEPAELAGRSWLAEVAGGAAGFESFGSVVVLPGDCASTGAAKARAIARVIVFRFMRISMK